MLSVLKSIQNYRRLELETFTLIYHYMTDTQTYKYLREKHNWN